MQCKWMAWYGGVGGRLPSYCWFEIGWQSDGRG
nr:hypothetical protein [Bacillus thuringiensis]